MFFYLSKIFWFVVDPGNFLFILLILGVVLLWSKWKKTGRIVCALACLYYGVVGLLPTGTYFLDILEQRFPQAQILPSHVDGIIVLGGVVDIKQTLAQGKLVFSRTRERVDVLGDLTLKYPGAQVVFTSGAGSLYDQNTKEADLIRPYLMSLVAHPENLIFENQSRNTYENVVFSKKKVQPKTGSVWLMVTSASHMPRAMGVFRAENWPVIAYPVNFLVGGRYLYEFEPLMRRGLTRLRTPLHEWLGLLAYYLTGKTSDLFPAP